MDLAQQAASPEAQAPIYYAGFWRRAGAAIIDGILLGAFVGIFASILGVKFIEYGEQTSGQPAWFQLIGLVLGILYYAGMESSKYQATLGKQAVGVKVVGLNGQKISFGRAALRYISKFVSGAIIFIGYIMVVFTAKKQGLHDMIAGTLVIKR